MKYLRTAALFTLLFFVTSCAGVRDYYNPDKGHHLRNRFTNNHITKEYAPSRMDFMRWIAGYGIKKMSSKCEPDEAIYMPIDLKKIYNPPEDAIQITWIGHSTFLIQVDGLNILTDPLFSKRASPVQFAGPKRISDLPIEISQLPPIDIVLISHNHYDHLDYHSIKQLGNKPEYFIPLGLSDWFSKIGITNVKQLDWWDKSQYGKLGLDFVPAQHYSGRGLFDYNKSLWGGWVVETSRGNIYFAGDSGYSEDFKEIGKRLKPVKLALLPIGSYAPYRVNHLVHISPKDAVQITKDIGAKHSVAMHWGTLDFAAEPICSPPVELKKELKNTKIDFTKMKIGESRVY